MKAYILSDEDFEKLKAELSRDPKHGLQGSGGVVLSKEEEKAFETAHKFYWYHVSRWIDKMKEGK